MTNENVWVSKDTTDLKSKIPAYFSIIETNSADEVLLGACNFGGSYWNGSMWLFQKPEDAAGLKKNIVSMDVDSGASAIKFLPSGNQIMVADYTGHLRLVHIEKAAADCPSYFSRTAEYYGHDDFVTCIDVDKAGEVFLTGAMDESSIVWDVETSAIKAKFTQGHNVKAVAFQPEQNAVFVSATQNGRAFLWDTRCERPGSQIIRNNNAFTSLDWIDNYRGILSDETGLLFVFDIRNKGPSTRYSLCKEHGIRKIRAKPSSSLFAIAADDLTVKVFDYSNDSYNQVYESHSHRDFASGLAWSNKSNMLLSCGWDSEIFTHLISTETKGPELTPEGYPGHTSSNDW